MSKSLPILDMCRIGMLLDIVGRLLSHVGIGFDANHPLAPDRGGQSGSAAHIHDERGTRRVNQLR